ncbi:MAG TPA: hypothetical protein VLA03_03965, partial [Draconibacterium sp.]|nr:hypothetical protein [Draconibacterium sp.]
YLLAQMSESDTVTIDIIDTQKQEQFYDSLKVKASKRKLTRLVYDFLISPPRPYVDKKALALNYYSQLEGKIISEIRIKSLDVFGPTFQDTSNTTSNKFEKAANKIHTKSNLKSLEKLLLFKVGDVVDPDLIYENERLIRSLPYIKATNIILEQDSIYAGLVKVLILIKDRFSFGATGNVNGIQSAAFEIYNNNIFGVGHEISFVFAGHMNKQPYLGTETYYKIKNVRGKFVDISFAYLNTYKSEGFKFNFNKPFITTSIKWGYGATGLRMFRTNYIFENDVIYTELPMDLTYYGAWGGHSFHVKQNQPESAQIVLSAGFNSQKFYKRPEIELGNVNYFANRTFLLSSVTFTQRRFIQDELVFSYGITEDIPEGFKNEIVYGYEINEFGNRHYAHILLSNGNLLINKKGYLYLEGDIGSYYGERGFEQGQIDARVYFISKLFNLGQKGSRLFVKTDYTTGFHRLEIENLNFSRNNTIRGFRSNQAFGKQRLSLNLEYVLFLRKEFYKFNMALFGFTDIGVIGSNDDFILTQNYYSGIGLGIRLHNENLVFKTLQLRLAFYPFHPSDMSFVGFVLEEQSKRQFYSFEPTQPLPLKFE